MFTCDNFIRISTKLRESRQNVGGRGTLQKQARLATLEDLLVRRLQTLSLAVQLPGSQGITDSVLYLSFLVMQLEMSDVDSKSSSGSETNSSANAGEDSLDFMQRMIVDQQQHLISQYQCEKSNTSGVNGKCYAPYPAWNWEV